MIQSQNLELSEVLEPLRLIFEQKISKTFPIVINCL